MTSVGDLTDLAMWTAIVASFLPVLVAFLQQPRWSQGVRVAVSTIASGIAGLGTVYFTNADLFDTRITPTVVLTVIIASQAAYRAFWKPAGIKKLELATSPKA